MSLKVVDLNIEEAKEEAPAPKPIEEVEEQTVEPEVINEVVEESNEIPKEEEPKEKPKRQTQKDRIQCPKCLKEVSLKTFRYSHEKNCGGQLPEKPVKPHTNPKPKTKPKAVPKPPPEIYYSSSDDDDEVVQQPMIKKKHSVSQPINPASVLSQHYQFLQNQTIQQKQERYNNLCMNMFSSKSKKR